MRSAAHKKFTDQENRLLELSEDRGQVTAFSATCRPAGSMDEGFIIKPISRSRYPAALSTTMVWRVFYPSGDPSSDPVCQMNFLGLR